MKIKNHWYSLLLMNGGIAHLGKPLDVNNDVVYSIVIWLNQPFKYPEETPWYVKTWFDLIRWFKPDVFGRSGLKKFIKNLRG